MCIFAYVCRLAPGRAAVAQDCKEAAGKCLCHWCHPGKADTQSSSHGHILGPDRSPNTLATTIPLLALSLCFLSLTHRCSLSLSLWHLQLSCSFCLCQQNTHTCTCLSFWTFKDTLTNIETSKIPQKYFFFTYHLETFVLLKD